MGEKCILPLDSLASSAFSAIFYCMVEKWPLPIDLFHRNFETIHACCNGSQFADHQSKRKGEQFVCSPFVSYADVAKLANAAVSKTAIREDLWVQIPPSAPPKYSRKCLKSKGIFLSFST